MAGLARVRPASGGGPCAVRHPEHGEMVVPNLLHTFSADDPLVREYPWLFVIEAADVAPIEQATRAPGERRNVRRGK